MTPIISSIILLLPAGGIANVQCFMDGLLESLVANLSQLAFKSSLQSIRSVNAPTPGKTSRFALVPCIGFLDRVPISRVSAPPQHMFVRPASSCSKLFATRDDGNVRRKRVKVWHLGRRSASLVAAICLVETATKPALALADEEPAQTADCSFTDGPDVLKYCDIGAGGERLGDIPFKGAVLKVNYDLKLAATGKTVRKRKYFVFSAGTGEVTPGWEMAVMGKGKMGPMAVGGTRKVLIPPQLAYGAKGGFCGGGGQQCSIPPDSILELFIKLVAIKNEDDFF